LTQIQCLKKEGLSHYDTDSMFEERSTRSVRKLQGLVVSLQ